jgi:hypothetical protein
VDDDYDQDDEDQPVAAKGRYTAAAYSEVGLGPSL